MRSTECNYSVCCYFVREYSVYRVRVIVYIVTYQGCCLKMRHFVIKLQNLYYFCLSIYSVHDT